MQCPKCKTINSDEFVYCSECGTRFSSQNPSVVGEQKNINTVEIPADVRIDSGSVQTRVSPLGTLRDFRQPPEQNIPYPAPPIIPPGLQVEKKSRSVWPYAILGILVIFLFLGAGAALFFKSNIEALFTSNSPPAEILPDHLGMFYYDKDKSVLNEIRKLDAVNIGEARDKLIKDDSVVSVNEKPEMILYADAVEIPVADLKVVQLDTVKNDGTMKQIDFQASPVDGKPAMKRLKFSQSLAVGKYAFTKIDGYFDEGKHKFWAFEIKTAAKKDNGDLAKETVISSKPKPVASNTPLKATLTNVPANKPESTVPPGAKAAYCNDSNVVVRAAPSLSARKINALRRGEKIYVLQYSSNTDYWHGMQANWVYIQTEGGKSGWVFSPFISQ